MAKSKYIEVLEEQYTKKDAKSVLRYKALDNKWRYIETIKDASGGGMTEVTWQELKDKRDNGELVVGSLYRITDYQCTTTQENTRSAGHQFDIVLLALSENKLAEEGWAMMHDNIYDVTFDDGVTKKCYIYGPYELAGDPFLNIVDVNTLLGWTGGPIDVEINETNKTARCSQDSTLLIHSCTYNYFQNSNLSAWKVWYCLDNDKSRFAWADDSIDETILACITTTSNNKNFYRNKSGDVLGANLPYAWTSLENETKYTRLEEPESGRIAISNIPNGLPASVNIIFTPAHEGTNLPNGRGVIYRLIDEWNNDVAYDFKNILYLRNVDDADITTDDSGTDMYIPTFCLKDDSTGEYKDASVFAVDYSLSNISVPCCNNKIGEVHAGTFNLSSQFILNNVVIINYVANDDNIWNCNYFDIKLGLNLSFNSCNRIDVLQCHDSVISYCQLSYIMNLDGENLSHVNGIINNTKKVVWENIP